MNIFKATSAELAGHLAEAVTDKTAGEFSIAFVTLPGGTVLEMDKKGRMSALMRAVTDAETALTQAPELSRAALVFYEGDEKSALEWVKIDNLWRLAQE